MRTFSNGFVGAVVPCLLSAVLFDGSAGAIIFAGICFLLLSLFTKWVLNLVVG